MAEETKNKVRKSLSRNYLAKDFVGMRDDLLRHARVFFPNQIQDFSEAGLGGMFIEMAAYVGDTLSYYLDHQFQELNWETAVESKNIEQHLKNAGVKISGAAPSVIDINFYIKVPAKYTDEDYAPDPSCLPIFEKGSRIGTSVGISFELTHNIDFSERDEFGELLATVVQSRNNSGTPSHYFLYAPGLCISGNTTTERFSIPDGQNRFYTIRLFNPHVSSIDRVYDSDGNEYYEVESLSQDTIFQAVSNDNFSNDGVRFNLQVKPAPRRFITSTTVTTRHTSIQFGGGSPDSTSDDIIADPSSMALPLYGKTQLQKFSIDPATILDSKTLGVYPKNTTISVVYRYGGGAFHNIPENSVAGVSGIKAVFPNECTPENMNNVLNSIDVKNPQKAKGGADAPTLNQLRSLIPSATNMQNRVVTREDLLARLYTLPTEFGKVYRASIVNNPNNPLASILYIAGQDSSGRLVQCPDSLKRNLSTYLNEFRLISDAIDILDAEVVNYKISVAVTAVPGMNAADVGSALFDAIEEVCKRDKYQIGQPLIEADVLNVIINTVGVMSINKFEFINISGDVHGREYSQAVYNFPANKRNGMYFLKQNRIFEMRYPNFDIEVTI